MTTHIEVTTREEGMAVLANYYRSFDILALSAGFDEALCVKHMQSRDACLNEYAGLSGHTDVHAAVTSIWAPKGVH